MEKPAGVRIETHECAGCSLRHNRSSFFANDCTAGIRWLRPLRHPLQTKRTVKAVQVWQARQQSVRMLTHIISQAALAKFEDRSRDWRMSRGARAFASELTKHAVDHGQGWG